MNWEQIFNRLTDPERQEMTRLLLQSVAHPRHLRLHDLRPGHLLFPAALAQMVIFVWSVQMLDLPLLLAGYLVVTTLAVLPSAVARPIFHAHWVR